MADTAYDADHLRQASQRIRKTTRNYLAVVTLAAIVLWMR